MVRALDVATYGAASDPSRSLPRNFIVVTVKDLGTGEPVTFGFTDFGEDISTPVLDIETGVPVNHTFYGDNAPIQKMPAIQLRIGLEVVTVDVVLSRIHPVVAFMVVNHDCRNAKVQIYRGYLDPVSELLVADPTSRHVGQINGMPKVKGRIGGQGTVTLRVVGSNRILTKPNSVMRSYETQFLRGGDRGRVYGGTAMLWPINWGEVEESTSGTSTRPAPPPKKK